MLVNCHTCNKEYNAFPSEIKSGFAKYCSRSCFNIGRIISVKRSCLACKKEFFVYPAEIRKGGGKYCSRKCYFKAKKTKPIVKKTCLHCKTIFLTSDASQRFCSKICSLKSRGTAYKTNCEVCKKEFLTIPSQKQKYCSNECYLVEHTKNTWTTGICKGCEKEFRYIRHRKQTCCSLSCNIKYRLDKNNERQQVETTCQQCGKKFKTNKNRFKVNRGKYCSRKCYAEWISINKVGENSPSWKGGITNLYRRIRTLAKYYRWRKIILKRDKHKCVLCGTTEKLIVDHYPKSLFEIIKENNITTTYEANQCQELWDTMNGRVLCVSCHIKTDNYGEKIKQKYKNNKITQK